ncbi:hypothetical protein N9M66_02355 [Litoreibacter sp.]|nr:hypothetical protein [Litoreibacter sp.]
MTNLFARVLLALGIGALTVTALPNRTSAQTYPIDCAILLCLSGDWPASVPCSRARAEFIRRITPWPVEPPLQIWHCPMGASIDADNTLAPVTRTFDIYFREPSTLPQSYPEAPEQFHFLAQPAAFRLNASQSATLSEGLALHLAQNRAEIDISGPEFNFVRSIRVFDVRYARQHESGHDGDCNRSATVVLGTYGTQGDFSWARSSLTALPDAHVGLERWGQNCPSIYHRSVFVDWRDYEGNYGFEQVDY